jgi:hypothetical protein
MVSIRRLPHAMADTFRDGAMSIRFDTRETGPMSGIKSRKATCTYRVRRRHPYVILLCPDGERTSPMEPPPRQMHPWAAFRGSEVRVGNHPIAS